MEFGYTNDASIFEAAKKWKEDAIKDGWTATPIYPDHESIDRCTKLQRDGFIAHVITRDGDSGIWKYQAKVNVWGSDGLAIKPPNQYDGDSIFKAESHCNYCDKDDVKTRRVSFAGRCCEECYPSVAKKLEYPGWCD